MEVIQFADKEYSWLQWPVKLKNCKKESLHITAKFFGRAAVNPDSVTKLLEDCDDIILNFRTHHFNWKPEIFHDLVYVLELVRHPYTMDYVHGRFDLINDQFKPWRPHISVPKDYWDFVNKTMLTPELEEIEIGPLQLCLGGK